MGSNETRTTRHDVITVLAIALVAYVLKNVVHEGLGHGGVCVWVGCRPIAISSAWFDGDDASLSAWAYRGIRAGGTLANLALGLVLVPIVVRARAIDSRMRFFVWMACVVNLLAGGGYLLADPVGNFGDWSRFLRGLPYAFSLRAALVLAGFAITMATFRFAVATIEPFVRGEQRRSDARAITVLPYVVASTCFVVAALRNPQGMHYAFTSGLATFGGTFFLVVIALRASRLAAPLHGEPVTIARSRAWLAAGALAAFVLFVVLGPGVSLRR